jgi:iron complex transport system permease protein
MIVGPDYRKLLPAAASLGACYLMVIDDLCRTLTASEIPIGVITGIIGVPMFLYFIYKGKINW